jgi:acetyltransferase-like isoleucine patch superfamily enzyme
VPYLSSKALNTLGFRHLGKNVLVSDKASIYSPESISIGDNSRIDDFCVMAGSLAIGCNVHVTVFCNLAGGRAGIELGDFSTLAYGCHIVAQTDDYSGRTMTNSTIPPDFKNETSAKVVVGAFSILGTNTIVLPGVNIGVGVASGARTTFVTDAKPWTIYVGTPAHELRDRSKDLLRLYDQFQQIHSRVDPLQ